MVLIMGIDVGTGGARASVFDLEGHVIASGATPFHAPTGPDARGYFEQDPEDWLHALEMSMEAAIASLRKAGYEPRQIAAISATSTSGTLCLVDAKGHPVRPALMYADRRAIDQAFRVQQAFAHVTQKTGTQITGSFALCRLCWLQAYEPDSLAAARWYLSPTDMLLGWLSGVWGVSDWTNMLKMGYDTVDLSWPQAIADELDLDLNKFPRVHAPGTPMGTLRLSLANRLGLSKKTIIVAGATDGNASQLASGAVAPGELNTTLGTTLVLKGVSTQLIRDPLGRVYCHRHPDGFWLPGGASNTGGRCLEPFAPKQVHLECKALAVSPTNLVLYPLCGVGERFPFVHPQAKRFEIGSSDDETVRYAAHLEGLAYVERLAYETLLSLGATLQGAIRTTGGGAHSRAGLQIRADVLGRPISVPAVPEATLGAAMLAAIGYDAFPDLSEAAQAMVHQQVEVEPRPGFVARYAERYCTFLEACRTRGYLS